MNRFAKPRTLAALLFVLGGFLPQAGFTAEVLPGEGISFNQVDFTFELAPLPDSDTGEILVDVELLRSATGLTAGFINVETTLGWSVQNLPIFPDFPYPKLTAHFDLGTVPGIDDVTEIDLYVDYSPNPTTDFVGGALRTFAVGEVEFNAEGVEGQVELVSRPDPPATVTFELSGIIEVKFQPNHPNIQAAHNQCMPAAVATSLQWLENTYGIDVPHTIGLGLGTDANGDGAADDGTLVGQLDIEMQRTFRSREDGDPTLIENGLRGKLRYIGKNGLADDLDVKHMGLFGGGPVSETVMGPDDMEITVTSTGLGSTVTAERLIQEICDGEDVELEFGYVDGGGHTVEVVGAGSILGVPFVMHQSDYKQSDVDNLAPPAGDGIDDNEGTDRVDFSFLVDTDMDGQLNLVYNKMNANVRTFFSQSPHEDPIFSDGFESGDLSSWSTSVGGP